MVNTLSQLSLILYLAVQTSCNRPLIFAIILKDANCFLGVFFQLLC